MTHYKKEIFTQRLLFWWEHNRQNFPWREETDPYRILIAEILLRKTTAKQAASVYKKFLTLFPDPKSLAEASVQKLENSLKPLGMYSIRARLLKNLGEVLIKKFSGRVPACKRDLLVLPGVKEYTANAVLCFAYGKDVPLVDTNIIRIFRRVFAVKSNKKRARNDRHVWRFAQKILPKNKAREFNLALIDFAHKICRPKKPACSSCIMQDLCSSSNAKSNL